MPVHRCKVVIPNELGLHMRAAKVFADSAGRYHASVSVGRGELVINGKSIMGLMMLAATWGTELSIETDGRDAEQALAGLSDLVRSGFGEGVSERGGA